MRTRVDRRTVDLSSYPDLVAVYLGMRVNRITGLKTLFGFGPKISSSVSAKPEGLLHHETFLFSFFPAHPAFANTGTMSTRCLPGHGPIRTGNGGKPF